MEEKAKTPITEAERRRRQAAVDYARASVGLEGFKLSDADLAHARRFVDGEINLEEFSNQLHDWVDVRLAEKRLADVRNGKSDSVPLEELMKHYFKDDKPDS